MGTGSTRNTAFRLELRFNLPDPRQPRLGRLVVGRRFALGVLIELNGAQLLVAEAVDVVNRRPPNRRDET